MCCWPFEKPCAADTSLGTEVVRVESHDWLAKLLLHETRRCKVALNLRDEGCATATGCWQVVVQERALPKIVEKTQWKGALLWGIVGGKKFSTVQAQQNEGELQTKISQTTSRLHEIKIPKGIKYWGFKFPAECHQAVAAPLLSRQTRPSLARPPPAPAQTCGYESDLDPSASNAGAGQRRFEPCLGSRSFTLRAFAPPKPPTHCHTHWRRAACTLICNLPSRLLPHYIVPALEPPSTPPIGYLLPADQAPTVSTLQPTSQPRLPFTDSALPAAIGSHATTETQQRPAHLAALQSIVGLPGGQQRRAAPSTCIVPLSVPKATTPHLSPAPARLEALDNPHEELGLSIATKTERND